MMLFIAETTEENFEHCSSQKKMQNFRLMGEGKRTSKYKMLIKKIGTILIVQHITVINKSKSFQTEWS